MHAYNGFNNRTISHVLVAFVMLLARLLRLGIVSFMDMHSSFSNIRKFRCISAAEAAGNRV